MKHFKVYNEDDVFGPMVAYPEEIFNEKQRQSGKFKTRDEEVNSDEDLVPKNKKDCF